MNPPYRRAIPIWLNYAQEQQKKYNNTIIALVPTRTDTQWFKNIAKNNTIILMTGRITF